jgi:glycosyltransferase involved in cell wall biosynthesis
MRILIATGIFPPDIGGPAQYAKNLRDVWEREGHEVTVKAFSHLPKLPTGIRHLWFLVLLIRPILKADFIFCPDTFSAAVPAVLAAKLLRKTIIIRTGGDFLWEWYVERTGHLVLLKDFYTSRIDQLSLKEHLIFLATRFALQNADRVIFSTAWQRDIFRRPYNLTLAKTKIVENYYGPKIESFPSVKKDFIAGARPLKWKNAARVAEAFKQLKQKGVDVVYDDSTSGHERFQDKIAHSYAVIIASLGDISPNTILDAIRADKPFILTKETGFYDKLKDVALWVDPENIEDIAEKVRLLCDPVVYETYQRKVAQFTFTHSWEEIGEEIIRIFRLLSSR